MGPIVHICGWMGTDRPWPRYFAKLAFSLWLFLRTLWLDLPAIYIEGLRGSIRFTWMGLGSVLK